jgi:hypothetical protein
LLGESRLVGPTRLDIFGHDFAQPCSSLVVALGLVLFREQIRALLATRELRKASLAVASFELATATELKRDLTAPDGVDFREAAVIAQINVSGQRPP